MKTAELQPMQPMSQKYSEHRSPLRFKNQQILSSDSDSRAGELDLANKRESRTTAATTTANLESDLISRSTQKFS